MATNAANSTTTDPYAYLNGVSTNKTTGKTKSTSDDIQSQFMTMLVTQLQNQDPLNPMQSAEMTSQLAQINTVSGIEKLNSTMEKVLNIYDDGQSMQAASMLGKNVLVPGGNIGLTDGVAVGGFELEGDADKVTLTVKDANGLVVRTVEMGKATAGSHLYAWDGKNDAGTVLANGSYTVSVAALKGTNKVTSQPLQVGTVNAVVRGSSGFQLDVGTGSLMNFDDVRQIL
ncbi:Basal-body rod modification protein FlgD [Azospira sp. I13]|uniref:flagellar hook assembly protein FlgD n=1 Tax=Azospira sp. I13 TaxID=1765050 RepID=UPI000D46B323|nr:flagellar hook assembly protein FlgD [Azospira sp. I13]GBG00729.1 Basal-body rod modification protein FlgD [Azospira sp. I13]